MGFLNGPIKTYMLKMWWWRVYNLSIYVTQPCLHTHANRPLSQSEHVYYLSDFIISAAAEICLLEASTVKVLTVNVREGTKRSCQILLLTLKVI